jgi:hypothetical protein
MKFEVNISKKLESKIRTTLKQTAVGLEYETVKKNAFEYFMKECIKDFVAQLQDGDMVEEMMDAVEYDKMFAGQKED